MTEYSKDLRRRLKNLGRSIHLDSPPKKSKNRVVKMLAGGVAVMILLMFIIILNPKEAMALSTPDSSALYKILIEETKSISPGVVEKMEEGTYHEPGLILNDYVVSAGENLSYIADKTGISVDTIVSVNRSVKNIENVHRIFVGMAVAVPNRNGLMYTVKEGDSLSLIAQNYAVEESKIRSVNGITDIKAGEDIFIPGAKYSPAQRAEKLGSIFTKPVAKFRITSGFGYRMHPVKRVRLFHSGVDFAWYHGAPINAARDGVVTFAGTRGGYGNYVIIDHVGGYQTCYGHLKSFAVKRGTYVKRGQIIGYMGATGVVSGPHLHFEIKRYGRFLDPLSLTSLH